MRAVCLLGVFLAAKILVLAGRELSLSPWTPLAYLWQDLLFVVCFAGLEVALHPRGLRAAGWCLYAGLALYIAVNVPIACQLSTPLTWPMVRAARGTLADSIAYHVTWANVLRIVLVLAIAAALPLLLRRYWDRFSTRWLGIAAVTALLLATLGPFAAARVPTLGLERNVVAALVTTALPRVTALDVDGDWRASPFGSPSADDLTRYRGRAAGRNLVVIHLESTGARYLRPYGAAEDPMPHLTALCQQAIRFENAYTAYPETIKSFFAVHCATFPALDTAPEAYERVRTAALAELLADAGYHTGLFHSGRFDYLGMQSVIRHRGFDTLADAGAIGGERDSSFGIDEPSTVRRILGWIDDLPPGERFFVTYLPIAGHHPYATPRPGPFPMDEEMDRYRNALHYADEALGQLQRGLRERGLYDDTLFVIFGDHGEAFGQHAGNYGHTLFLYDENVRVPYVIAAPGLFREPIRVGRVASLADTAPTVLDLLGLPIPATYQGRSLLDGRSNLALFCTDYSLGFVGLRDGRWKMIHELDSGQSWLFDLEDDPDETEDLAADHVERVAVYREHLLAWCAAQKYRIMQ
jgi:hypothetical protein